MTSGFSFSPPVEYVYNPMDYAWHPYSEYVRRFADSKKRTLFLGMNPGPWGMAQTGVPFGEISFVKEWMGISGEVLKPERQHPKRPIEGFACQRSEVSGRRLWGLFSDRFPSAERFFKDHWVANYCPLMFIEKSGRNRTPDKLRSEEREPLLSICDEHLYRVVMALGAETLVGVGAFAYRRATHALAGLPCRVMRMLHPSPASPQANRGWAEQASSLLENAGVWDPVR